ncbi:MAG: hypothetical protein HZB39_10090 [Planctomycetes bacterium]|nr:hypothetical protein [Planctomycetota bacterium]
MHLEPVYLVAPQPDAVRPAGIRRRAVAVWVAAGFVAGLTGGAGSTWLALGRDPDIADDTMRWALTVQEGDLEALVAAHEPFLLTFVESGDRALLFGVRRLAKAVLAGEPSVGGLRADLAARVAGVIRHAPDARELAEFLEPLAACR